MIHLVERSKWQFETSGSGGFSIDIVAATGGVVKIFDPAHKEQVFHYGGIGAGISTPGLKVPKLGSVIARQLVGRALNASGSTVAMWNTGLIYKTAMTSARELTRADFTGACILADLGFSTPFIGRVGSAFLMGMDPVGFITELTSPTRIIADTLFGDGPAIIPKAIMLILGDSRGLVAGGNAYIGYMR